MRIFAGVIAGLLLLAVSTQVWAAEVIRLGFFDKQAVVDRSEMGKEGLAKAQSENGTDSRKARCRATGGRGTGG